MPENQPIFKLTEQYWQTSINRRLLNLRNELDSETQSETDDANHTGSAYRKVIVCEGFGNGRVPDDRIMDQLTGFAADGVLVIRSTSVPGGKVENQDNDSEKRFIPAGLLSTEQAGALAQVALAAARKEGKEMTYSMLKDIFAEMQ